MRISKTNWYPADVKPVNVGFYECGYKDGVPMMYAFHYWDGKCWNSPDNWCNPEFTNDPCMNGGQYPSDIGGSTWRGITKRSHDLLIKRRAK